MAAFSAQRRHPVFREFFEQLTGHGKRFMAALAACMRQLLTILNTMFACEYTVAKPTPIRLTLDTVAPGALPAGDPKPSDESPG